MLLHTDVSDVANVPSVPGFPVSTGESWRDFRPTVQNYMQTSPSYGFTYQDTTSAFVKGSQIPQ
jgi:hypothetical protein